MNIAKRTLVMVGLAVAGLVGLSVYARRAVRRFEDLEPESAGAPGAFIDADGLRLHYVEAGEGDPVLLIHGFGASTFSYRFAIPELAQHYRVVALDLKGFGYSERPTSSDYSLTAQADLVGRAMDRLGIERAAVVGHSMGGAVAMRLALRHPDRVSRLVLVDSATERHMARALLPGRMLVLFVPIIATLTVHRRAFRRFALRNAVHDPAHVTPEVVEGYMRPTRFKGYARGMAALLAGRGHDEPLALERIAQPTLILWGEHDRWLPPSEGEALAKSIPNAQLVLVRGAGHLPLEEQPDESNKALLEFLREPDPTATAPRGRAKSREPSG